jgi:2-dehydro-3-deoxyphosphogluconate aldolase/(4S)-4-hydroxy-2-oxoglutarate aldolase
MKVSDLIENGIIAIIRGHQPANILSIISALEAGGIGVVEITSDTPQLSEVITRATREFEGRMHIGVGTVLDPETARIALIAGAQFILSPSLNIETIKMTKRYGAISIPGAFTPTEILTAYENGADAVKVYPSNVLGPSYTKAIRDPLPQIPLVPTGGVTLDNIAAYFQAGAVAVGLGGALVAKTDTVDSTYLRALETKAAQFVEAKKGANQ